MAETKPRKAVFLDRDGTIIVDTVFSVDPSRFAPLPGTLEGLRRLHEDGWQIVVITNQSGIARGRFDETGLRAFHDVMTDWFAQRGVQIAGVYYCPHYANGTLPEYAYACDCRKPEPGMLLRAAKELNLDLAHSWMVGDRPCDIGAGRAAGCRTIRIGATEAGEDPADFDAANVAEAARIILQRSSERAADRRPA